MSLHESKSVEKRLDAQWKARNEQIALLRQQLEEKEITIQHLTTVGARKEIDGLRQVFRTQEQRIKELEAENRQLREQPGMIIYRSVRPPLDVPEDEKLEGKDEL